MREYKTTFDRKATTRQRVELWASQTLKDKNHENLNKNLVKTSKDNELNPEAPNFVPSRTLAQQSAEHNATHELDPVSRHLLVTALKESPKKPFRGEPHEYHRWWTSLKNRMDPLKLEPLDVIDILEAHTEGQPHQVVHTFSCAVGKNPGQALTTILCELERRFGSNTEVADGLLKRLESQPKIQGGEADPRVAYSLRELSDLCLIISQHIDFIPDLSILNLNIGLSRVRQKLPTFIDNKWRKVKGSFREHPSFHYFCDFLKREVDLLCDDLRPSWDQSPLASGPASDSRAPSNSIKAPTPGNFCKFHEMRGHNLEGCNAFENLPHEEKMSFLEFHKLCYRCLGSHFSRNCRETVKCARCFKEGHLRVMHREGGAARHTSGNSATENSTGSDQDKPSASLRTNTYGFKGRNCGKTVLVQVSHHGNTKPLLTYAIIDTESNNTFASSELFDYFGINTSSSPYSIATLGGTRYRLKGRHATGLKVRGITNGDWFDLPAVKENNCIPDTLDEVATREMVKNCSAIHHLSDKYHDLAEGAHVTLLIGRDSEDLMWCETKQEVAPFCYETRLGWAVVGSVSPMKCQPTGNVPPTANVLLTRSDKMLDHDHFSARNEFEHKNVTDIFERWTDDDEQGLSRNDLKFVQIISGSIKINDKGNLETPLPLKNPEVRMPDNKFPVLRRTSATTRRLKKSPDTLKLCLASIGKNLSEGYVEQVPETELERDDGKVWYLPLFPVIHPKKNKVRLVYDSAATYQGTSLNEALLQGPDVNNSLRGVLTRLRENSVAFVADIEGMFNAFFVEPHYRDLMRFFWFRNNDSTKELITYRAKTNVFGNTCSPSIATTCLRSTTVLTEPKREGIKETVFNEASYYIRRQFY